MALPLCLGIALASGTSVYSGLVAGIIGGIVVSALSGSSLSVSGPAAGLTAICATALTDLGAPEIFFVSVAIAGLIQMVMGIAKLGNFTHLIPSSVIKGMLTAIGVILMSKQIPLLIGYNKPDFYTNELFNIFTFNHAFQHIENLYHNISAGVILISITSFVVLVLWKRFMTIRVPFLPASFVTVLFGVILSLVFEKIAGLQIDSKQFVNIPTNVFADIKFPEFGIVFSNTLVWKYALVLAVVASLEILLSIEAVDKLDSHNRITPRNRELLAQGTGNLISGLAGGLPITAVIVRGSANAEAGARTRMSGISHGVWLLLALAFAIPLINYIPYCVLAVILVRTGFNLAKPKMIRDVYKQGREQFIPFIVTVVAILFSDLLIGVLIGLIYSFYFIIRHTYRAGFTIKELTEGHTKHFVMELALNVSYLNKKRIREALDKMPPYSIVEINGADSVYIDHDILEIFQEYKTKAHLKHIDLRLINIREVEILEVH